MIATRSRSRSPAVVAPQNRTAKGAPKKNKQKASTLVFAYLVLYNALSAAAWAYFALQFLRAAEAANWKLAAISAAHRATARLLLWVQAAAVLEIAHAALGLVPSQVLSTAMQIASRLFVVTVAQHTERDEGRWAYAIFALAWLLSDLTRYCYYVANLLSAAPSLLTWARYSFFIILYPLGTFGEAALIASAAYQIHLHGVSQLHYPLLILLVAVYPFGFRFMFQHMLRQRQKYLGLSKKSN